MRGTKVEDSTASECGPETRDEYMSAPRGVLDLWQAKDLREGVFGSVAMIGLTGEFSEVWQEKELGSLWMKTGRMPLEIWRGGQGRISG
jgi:hypothetical protein